MLPCLFSVVVGVWGCSFGARLVGLVACILCYLPVCFVISLLLNVGRADGSFLFASV